MNKFLRLFFVIALLATGLQAQSGAYTADAVFTPHYPGYTVRFTCALDSVDVDTSRTFSFASSDAAIQAGAPIYAQRSIVSASGTPKVSTYIDGSYDGSTWFACDTLGTDVTSETTASVTVDLNVSAKGVFPWYRMRNVGVATNNPDTIADWILYLYHNDK